MRLIITEDPLAASCRRSLLFPGTGNFVQALRSLHASLSAFGPIARQDSMRRIRRTSLTRPIISRIQITT